MLKIKSQSLVEYLVVGGLVAVAALPLIAPYSKNISQKIADSAPKKSIQIQVNTMEPNYKVVEQNTPTYKTPVTPIKLIETPPNEVKEPPHHTTPPKPPTIKPWPPINGCNACQNIGFFENLGEYGVKAIDPDLRVSSDALLCSIFWYFPQYQSKYGLSNSFKSSAGDEIHRRYYEEGKLMCDPYEVKINGSNYVFVRDKNGDGIFNGVEEILGFTDTESSLFKELKELDANNDGYVSAEELAAADVALLKDENGKLTTEEYDMNNVNGIKLTTLGETDDAAKASGVYGTFELDLKDQEAAAGKETFKFISALGVLTAGIAGAYFFSRYRRKDDGLV